MEHDSYGLFITCWTACSGGKAAEAVQEFFMKTIRIISLFARVALMVTLGLGLLFWIAQLFVWSGLLVLLAQIDFTSIHEGFGTFGVLGLLILGSAAVFTKGSRLLGAGSII